MKKPRIVRLSTERTFEASHFIPNHKGKCINLHGHSYRIGISISGFIGEDGMLVDFGDLKALVDRFDHYYLNDSFKKPTAENMARYFALKIARLNRNIIESTVTLYETENCCATSSYTNDQIR